MLGSIAKVVAKNTSFMFGQMIITWTSTFLLMLIMPRYLGPIEYGKVFLAGAITDVFRLFVTYGGNYLVTKHVARDREKTGQILVDAVVFRVVFGVLSILGVYIFSLVTGYADDIKILLLIYAIGYLWEGATTGLYACYQGHELLQYTSLGVIANRVFNSAAAISAILLGAGPTTIIVIFVLGSFLNFVVLASFSRKIVKTLPKVNWQDTISQIKSGVPYFMFSVFSVIYFRIDSVMLSRLVPEPVIGWYGGGYKFFDVLNFFPYIFSVALYPSLSRLWSEEVGIHNRVTQKSLELMILAGIPISAVTALFAPHIIELFYGVSGFEPSIAILQMLSTGLVILYVDMVLGTTLLAADKQRQQSLISLIAIPINIVLNLILIPYSQTHHGNGGLGAALATTVTELFIMGSFLWVIPAGTLKGFRASVIAKSLLSCGVMTGSILLLSFLRVHWVIQLLVAPVTYVISVQLMRTLEKPEEQFLLSLLAKWRSMLPQWPG
jgi:O-antigen/teichoic acid export membrane protein